MLTPQQLAAFSGTQPKATTGASQPGLTPQQLAAFGGTAAPTAATAAPQAPEIDGHESLLTTLKNAAENLPSSIGKQFKNLASLINPKNDIKVAKGLGQQIIGAFSPATAGGDLETPITSDAQAQAATQGGAIPAEVPVKQGANVTAFNQFGSNFLGGALGGKGVAGLKEKLETDPAGLALDLSLLADSAGSAIEKAGDATDLGPVSKTGQVIQDVGHKINPISAPFSAAGGILSKLGSASENLNTDAVSSANELGVKLPLEAQVNSGTLQTVTNFLKSGMFGKALKASTDTASTKLQEIADATAKKLSDAPDSPTLGTDLKAGLQTFQDTFNNTKDELYNKFTEEYGTTPATIENTKGAIQNLLQRYANDATPESSRVASTLQKTLDNLEYGKGQARTIIENLRRNHYDESTIKQLTGGAYQPTFNVLKATRTSIGAMLDKNPEFSNVYDALDKDRTASLSNIAPEAAAQIKKIDAAYAEHQQQIGSKAASLIQNSSPEQLVDSLIKGNNSTTLNTLKQIVPAEVFNGLGLAWMKSALDSATNSVTNKLDVKAFIAKVNEIDEPTKNVLFSQDQRSAINDTLNQLQKVKTAQDALDKASGGSSFLRNSQRIRELSVIPLALMGSTYLMKALVADIGGEFLTSKMLGSQLGQRLLTTGSPAIEGAGNALKAAGSAAAKTAQVRNLRP